MSRLAARRAAVQLVYEQLLGGTGGDDTLLGMIGFQADDGQDDAYIRLIVEGVQEHSEALDGQVAQRSTNRELERIPKVVRSILRVALYELLYLKDSPPSAVINEAVELAHRFGEDGDSRFINGVLGSFLREQQPT